MPLPSQWASSREQPRRSCDPARPRSMAGGAREVLTLQLGHFAGFVGAHWWNQQVRCPAGCPAGTPWSRQS